jgi:hypothetical protein
VGLDQLGLREASEGQYTRLLDFTTTVTWHPRYYSFLSWAITQALERTRQQVAGRERVDLKAWSKEVRRLDYVVAAATLAACPGTLRIIGTERLTERLGHPTGDGMLAASDDHIGRGGGAGSFATYAGPMGALGLVQDIAPSPVGRRLGEAFARSIEAAGAEALFSAADLPLSALASAGDLLGLHNLSKAAAKSPVVAAERAALRDALLDWEGVARGRPAPRRRVASIGMILKLHQLRHDRAVDLPCFREAILLGGIRNGGGQPLDLPASFEGVRSAWRLYQAHANAVYALEVLLALVLEALVADGRALVPRTAALARVLTLVADGLASGLEMTGAPPLDLEAPLAEVARVAEAAIRKDWRAAWAEPDLTAGLDAQWSRSRVGAKSPERAAALAATLLVCSQVRLEVLRKDLKHAWIGGTERWRWPPLALIDHLHESLTQGRSLRGHLEDVIERMVIRQHAGNVRRKLYFVPSQLTALFVEDGTRLEYVAAHHPGTSSPRFENAAGYLEELGYLDPVNAQGVRAVAPDGAALLASITERLQEVR